LATSTGYYEGPVQLWDVASGQLRTTLTDAAPPFAFSPNGQTLATSGVLVARLWDVASGQLKAVTLKGDSWPRQLAFSTDGRALATRDDSGKLRLWDVASASPITITAQTSLAQFPPWLAHPFSRGSYGGAPRVSLLDPFDGHVLATLQALPDAPASRWALPPDPAAP